METKLSDKFKKTQKDYFNQLSSLLDKEIAKKLKDMDFKDQITEITHLEIKRISESWKRELNRHIKVYDKVINEFYQRLKKLENEKKF